jgi:hypothetical protein
VTIIEVMDPAANTSSDCAYADRWHEEMRRAFDQRDVLPQAACEALVRVLENFIAEQAVDDGHLDEVRRTIALGSRPTVRVDAELEAPLYGNKWSALTPIRVEDASAVDVLCLP